MDAIRIALKFLDGIVMTVTLTALSFAIALVLGSLLALMYISPVRSLRVFAFSYIELMRMTPILALLVLLVWGLPKLGFMFSELTSVIVALGIYSAAWVAEVIRSGVLSIPFGQVEAARSLGMTFGQVITSLILPQAIRTVIPPIGSLFVVHIKTTSVAAVVGVLEITATAQRVNNDTAQWLWFLAAIAAYLILTIPAGLFARFLEIKMAIKR